MLRKSPGFGAPYHPRPKPSPFVDVRASRAPTGSGRSGCAPVSQELVQVDRCSVVGEPAAHGARTLRHRAAVSGTRCAAKSAQTSQQGENRQSGAQAVEPRFGVGIDRGVGRLRADAGLVRAVWRARNSTPPAFGLHQLVPVDGSAGERSCAARRGEALATNRRSSSSRPARTSSTSDVQASTGR